MDFEMLLLIVSRCPKDNIHLIFLYDPEHMRCICILRKLRIMPKNMDNGDMILWYALYKYVLDNNKPILN